MIQKPLLIWDFLLSKSKLAFAMQSKTSETPVLTKTGHDGRASIVYRKLPVSPEAQAYRNKTKISTPGTRGRLHVVDNG